MDEAKIQGIVERFIQRYASRHAEYDRQVAEAEEASTTHLQELGIDVEKTDPIVSSSLNIDELIRPAEVLSKAHHTDFKKELSMLSDDECIEVHIRISEYILAEIKDRVKKARSRNSRREKETDQ